MKSFTSLLQRQQQSLVMTPQLIESIRLLQLAHAELHQFVEQEIEKNPFLDLASNDGGASGDVSSDDPNIGAGENHVDGPTRTDMPELPSQWKSIRDTGNIRSGKDLP